MLGVTSISIRNTLRLWESASKWKNFHVLLASFAGSCYNLNINSEVQWTMNHLMALDSTASAQGSGLSMIAMLLVYAVFIVALYFIFFRPQSKKKKKEAEMRKNAQVGDEITTIGGICGRIVAVKDETDSIVIETGSDKAKLRVKRWAIGSVDTVHEDDQN